MASIEHLGEDALPWVLQTTISRANLGKLPDLLSFAAEKGARAHNLYLFMPTGRGQAFTSDIKPQEYETLLASISRRQHAAAG